jgi:hypothetical protein
VGRVFHEKAIAKGLEQGFNRFGTIVLLARKAKQKSKAVQGVRYLTDSERTWNKAQNKFPVQAIKDLESDKFNLKEFFEEITDSIQEDDIKEIKNTKTEE